MLFFFFFLKGGNWDSPKGSPSHLQNDTVRSMDSLNFSHNTSEDDMPRWGGRRWNLTQNVQKFLANFWDQQSESEHFIPNHSLRFDWIFKWKKSQPTCGWNCFVGSLSIAPNIYLSFHLVDTTKIDLDMQQVYTVTLRSLDEYNLRTWCDRLKVAERYLQLGTVGSLNTFPQRDHGLIQERSGAGSGSDVVQEKTRWENSSELGPLQDLRSKSSANWQTGSFLHLFYMFLLLPLKRSWNEIWSHLFGS